MQQYLQSALLVLLAEAITTIPASWARTAADVYRRGGRPRATNARLALRVGNFKGIRLLPGLEAVALFLERCDSLHLSRRTHLI